MSTYTCGICGRTRDGMPILTFDRHTMLTRELAGGWHLCDNRLKMACPTCNPYTRLPLRTIWQRGWDAFVAGEKNNPPYENHSFHGGTFGTRANRVWQQGWRTAERADTDKAIEDTSRLCEEAGEPVGVCGWCAGEIWPDSEICDVCGGHIDCCMGHEENDDVQDMA